MAFRKLAWVVVVLCSGGLVACAPADKPRGQLMIGVATDMSIPKKMDQVHVEVLAIGGVEQSFDFALMPTALGEPMPGTLAIVPPNAGGQTVRVRLIAEQNMSPEPPVVRVVREAVVKVPTDRTALLPMPLHWLCDGVYRDSDDGSGSYQSDCDEGQTCVAGVCADANIKTESLPDYAPGLVFGGGDDQGNGGRCMDVAECFGDSKPVVLDSHCTFAVPKGADATMFNVAVELATGGDGVCTDGAAPRCFLPLDSDPVEGWQIVGSRVELPPAVCTLIGKKKALQVTTTAACPTKDPSVPTCGPWTNVKTSSTAPDGESSGTGGSSSSSAGAASVGVGAGTGTGTGASSGVAGSSTGGAASVFSATPCTDSSQCSVGQCYYGVCAILCSNDAACPSGPCINLGKNSGACVDLPCGSCPMQTACSTSEGFCRNTCTEDANCLTGQVCSSEQLCITPALGEGGSGGAPG
jgi:hypothetical protein